MRAGFGALPEKLYASVAVGIVAVEGDGVVGAENPFNNLLVGIAFILRAAVIAVVFAPGTFHGHGSPDNSILAAIGAESNHSSRHGVEDSGKGRGSFVAFTEERGRYASVRFEGPRTERSVFAPDEEHGAVGIAGPGNRGAVEVMCFAVWEAVDVDERIDGEGAGEIGEENGAEERFVVSEGRFVLIDEMFAEMGTVEDVEDTVFAGANKEIGVFGKDGAGGTKILIGEIITVGGGFGALIVAEGSEPIGEGEGGGS